MTPLVDAFLRARTASDHNHARLALQRLGTPLEVRTIAREVPDLPREVRAWVVRLDEYCTWEQPELALFSREEDASSGQNWVLYRSGDAKSTPQLLVGFAGAVGNLFQPAPVILQHLPRGAYDLLLLRDSHRRGFTAGVAENDDLVSLTSRIARVAAGYSAVVTYGTSSGGHPALHVGTALGARRAVSVGGRARTDLPVLKSFLLRDHQTEVLCVHGSRHVGDAASAAQLARQFLGSRVVALDGASRHNVQHEAFQGGRLTAFMDALLGPGTVPVRADRGREDETLEVSSVLLDLPAHQPDAPPSWARVEVTGARRGRNRFQFLAERRPGSWSTNAGLRWRLAKRIARRLSLSRDRAERLEALIHRRAGVRLRFGRR